MLFSINLQIDFSNYKVKEILPNFLFTFEMNMIVIQNSFKEFLWIGFDVSRIPSFMNSSSD